MLVSSPLTKEEAPMRSPISRTLLPLIATILVAAGWTAQAQAQSIIKEEPMERRPRAVNRTLPWPTELPQDLASGDTRYEVPESNYLLDFHGNPQAADLIIFMAGNQYMVLPELVRAYTEYNPYVKHVFYATTPPGVLINAMASKRLVLGNFWLDLHHTWPDLFLTGPRQQKILSQKGYAKGYYLYSRNRGVGLLVKKGNPLHITSVQDLARPDVRVAISSPQREPASFESYGAVIKNQGGQETLDAILAKPSTLHPLRVHHRENPQMIFDGRADVAPMFFHFGKYLTAVFPESFDFVVLPEAGNLIASLGMALVEGGKHREAAEKWLEFMRTDVARRIYEKHGFSYATAEELKTLVVPE
jgi:ABC-type molybdate transport system substrate-binding protein